MLWNWKLAQWPGFVYDDLIHIEKENTFMRLCGQSLAYFSNVSQDDLNQFKVEILSLEGAGRAKIEGEILERESLQSAIRRQFGLTPLLKKESVKEVGMAKALIDVYKTFNDPLDHDTLFRWHYSLFQEDKGLEYIGCYRAHDDPMQIVSNKIGSEKVYFEAPPSKIVSKEMDHFIHWYNHYKGLVVVKAAIAHLYFESIHPFEDGNGRIGRLLVEKTLSQGVKIPALIAISKVLEEGKKEYYKQLENSNCTLKIDDWISYFTDKILEAQKASMKFLEFLIVKSKILSKLSPELNERQIKVLLRIFKEGPFGFRGGLSAENYITITKASRATVTRDLNDLLMKGALVKTGELKHTRYFINSQFL
jgi:Fic family protein